MHLFASAGREGQKADQAQGIKGGLTIVDQGAESARNRAVVKGENKLNNIPEETANRVRYEDLSKEEVDNNKVLPNRNQDGGQKQYQGMGDNQVRTCLCFSILCIPINNFSVMLGWVCLG